jgi:hypothetical protein
MRKACVALALVISATSMCVRAQDQKQPKVAPGPGEPDWEVVLRERYGLAMFADLKNPVKTTPIATPGLFRKAGPGPVKFTPVIALGMPNRTRGGWYSALADDRVGTPKKVGLWSYEMKNTADDLRTGRNLPPALDPGSTTDFDPGSSSFGLWVSNDGLADGGVFSQPLLVARLNERLSKQPYKAMIYANRDKATGNIVPNSFVIGWEYSTNDDFQDVVGHIDNVTLIDAPALAQ